MRKNLFIAVTVLMSLLICLFTANCSYFRPGQFWDEYDFARYMRTGKETWKVFKLKIKVAQFTDQNSVRVGEKFVTTVVVRNESDYQINQVAFGFNGSLGYLKIIKRPERGYLPVPPHSSRNIRFEYKSVRAGVIKLPKLVLRHVVYRSCRYKMTLRTKATISDSQKLKIRSFCLPGVEHKIESSSKKTSGYFRFIVFKILGVSLLVILILKWFGSAVNSHMVDSLGGRITLAYIMAVLIIAFLILFKSGLVWLFWTTPPPLLDIGIILVGSWHLSFRLKLFQFIQFKNPVLDSLFPAVLMFLFSYILYIGIMAYLYGSYLKFPWETFFISSIFLGYALNLYFLRKEKRR